MIRVIWEGFWIDLLGDFLFHSGDCCTYMCLADMHGFMCCGCFIFDAAIALLFLMFCVHSACVALSAELLALLVCMFVCSFALVPSLSSVTPCVEQVREGLF